MSQCDLDTSIIELARAAGARKLLLKKMVLQCIEDRGVASDSGRLARQSALQQFAPALITPALPAPIPSTPVAARPAALPPEIESRLALLEAHLHRSGPSVSQSRQSLDALAARVDAIDHKMEVLRRDLRSLDFSGTCISEQVKSFDQIFASLGRDSHKLSHTLDALALEFRKSQAQMPDDGDLQDRLTRLESGMVRTIDLLQSPGHGIADLSQMRERFSEIEAGMQRVMKVVEDLPRPQEEGEVLAEREATAKVLASLTRLIEGMKSSDRRQVRAGDSRI